MSDVPLGAFLSGGVDSSLVVGLMARGVAHAGQDVLDRLRRAGVRRARARAHASREHFGTEHHEFVVSPDALAILDELIAHFDEPFADSSAIPTWYVSEMARRHVTVVLSGDGGDELFGGYDRYLPHPRVAAFDRCRLPGTARAWPSLVWPLLPHGVTRQELPPARRAATSAAAISTRSRYFQPDEKRGAAGRRRAGGSSDVPTPSTRSAGTSTGFDALPLAQPDDALRLRDLPARGRPDEGRSHEHGALDRVARAAARQRGRRVRGARCRPSLKIRERAAEARAQGGRGRTAAGGDPQPPQAGLRRPARRVVPRRACASCSPTCCCRRARGSAATSSRASSSGSFASTSPAGATTRCGCGSCWSSSCGTVSILIRGGSGPLLNRSPRPWPLNDDHADTNSRCDIRRPIRARRDAASDDRAAGPARSPSLPCLPRLLPHGWRLVRPRRASR